MTSVLYSLRTKIDRDGTQHYRLTKFLDGEVESSYHVSREQCECPAGQRPTCRHRQMLPHMLNASIANTHWFYDHDHGGQVVDFEGMSREAYERAAREAPPLRFDMDYTNSVGHSPAADALQPAPEGLLAPSPEQLAPTPTLQPIHPWRRL